MTIADVLPPDISAAALARLAAIALVASISRGFSRFGAALIFMPLAATVVAPRTAAALLLVIDFICAAPLAPGAWRLADRKSVGIIALRAWVGVALGAGLLTQLQRI